MKELISCSALAVARMLLVVLAGVYFAKKGVLNKETRHALSKIILQLMLPALYVVSMGQNANIEVVKQCWSIPVTAMIFVMAGFSMGWLCCRILRIPAHLHRGITASSAFCNSSFLPYPLMMTLCAIVPAFVADGDAVQRSILYLSLFLLGHSPLLWLIANPYLGGLHWKELNWRNLLSPSLVSIFVGIFIGITPCLHNLFFGEHAPLKLLPMACNLISSAAFPCSLLLLGGNLAEKLPPGESPPLRAYIGLTMVRLVLMPIFGIGFTFLLLSLGIIPKDPIFLLVLMLESAVPPAFNLILIVQMHKKNEIALSRLMLCCYCACVPLLTGALAVMLYLTLR